LPTFVLASASAARPNPTRCPPRCIAASRPEAPADTRHYGGGSVSLAGPCARQTVGLPFQQALRTQRSPGGQEPHPQGYYPLYFIGLTAMNASLDTPQTQTAAPTRRCWSPGVSQNPDFMGAGRFKTTIAAISYTISQPIQQLTIFPTTDTAIEQLPLL
jgi:hypothetical protein